MRSLRKLTYLLLLVYLFSAPKCHIHYIRRRKNRFRLGFVHVSRRSVCLNQNIKTDSIRSLLFRTIPQDFRAIPN